MSNRISLERQLSHAEAALAEHVKVLEAAGISADAVSRDTKWRSLNSTRRKVANRLNAVAAVEARDAEAASRKAAAAADSSED